MHIFLIMIRLQHQIRNRINLVLALCFLIQPGGEESNLLNRSPSLLLETTERAASECLRVCVL